MNLGTPSDPAEERAADQPPATDTGKVVAACVLLAIPLVALLAVPTYAKEDPELFGLPFFFWYQFLWVFLCSAMTWGAHRLMLAARHPKGGAR